MPMADWLWLLGALFYPGVLTAVVIGCMLAGKRIFLATMLGTLATQLVNGCVWCLLVDLRDLDTSVFWFGVMYYLALSISAVCCS